MTSTKTLTALAIAAATIAAAPASAVITSFAAFDPIGTASNVQWANSGGSNANGLGATFTSTATGNSNGLASRQVQFSFLDPLLATAFSGITANFTLNTALTPPQAAQGLAGNTFLLQDGIAGSFSFTTVAPILFNSVLLSDRHQPPDGDLHQHDGQRPPQRDLGVVQRHHRGRRDDAYVHVGVPELLQRRPERFRGRPIGGHRRPPGDSDERNPAVRAAQLPRRRQRHLLERPGTDRYRDPRARPYGA